MNASLSDGNPIDDTDWTKCIFCQSVSHRWGAPVSCQKQTHGDITLATLCHCQRASKISPFIIFAVFDVSFRRYNLWINYSFLHLYFLFSYRDLNIDLYSHKKDFFQV